MIVFLSIVIVALLLCGATVSLLFIGPKILLRPKRSTSQTYKEHGALSHPSELQLPCEELWIRTREQFHLHCWLIKNPNAINGTIVYLHGIGDNKALGIAHAQLLFNHGFNVAMLDFRAHGSSEGTYCTYGYYEKYDVQHFLDALSARKDFSLGKFGVYGLSMGAAIALQTASIDKRICAVVAENSFATLRTIFDDYQKRIIKLPFHYLRNLIIARSEKLADFDAKKVSPLNAVKFIEAPILYIVGKDDEKISPQYSQQLFDATRSTKEIFFVANAHHANVRYVAGKTYDDKLISFFTQHLQPSRHTN